MEKTSIAAALSIALLVGCGSSGNAPTTMAAKPDVIITFDGAQHACVVALYSEAQGSTIACADVIPFLRDELRLKKGSLYDTRTVSTVDHAEIQKTTADLQNAGYRFIGGQ